MHKLKEQTSAIGTLAASCSTSTFFAFVPQVAPNTSLPGASTWVYLKASTDRAAAFCCFMRYKRSKEGGSGPHCRKHSLCCALTCSLKIAQAFWCRFSSCACTFSIQCLVSHTDPPVEILLTDSSRGKGPTHPHPALGFSFPWALSAYRKTYQRFSICIYTHAQAHLILWIICLVHSIPARSKNNMEDGTKKVV